MLHVCALLPIPRGPLKNGSLAAFTCTHLKVSTSEVKVKQGDIPTTKRDQNKSAHILLGM